ncbi:MAG: hypothetical protein D6759_19480, partial [Chloroflexi bacterium]
MARTVVFWLENLAAGLFLWFGLYLLTRDLPAGRRETRSPWWWHLPSLWASTTMGLVALFFFGVAIRSTMPTVEEYIFWRKMTWWGMPITGALWLRIVVFLGAEEGRWRSSPLWERVIFPFILLYAIFIALTGTFTELIWSFRGTYPGPLFESFIISASKPAFYLYGAYYSGIMWVSAVLLFRLYQGGQGNRSRRQGFKWMWLGGTFLAIAVTVIIAAYTREPRPIPEQVGDLTGTVGLVLIMRGIVSYGALVRNQILREDFFHALTETAGVVFFYLLVFHLAHWIGGRSVSPIAVSSLIGLVVLTHTLFDWGRLALDRALLPGWLVEYRWRLARLQREILKAPNPQQALQTAEMEFAQIAQEARRVASYEVIRQEIHRLFRHAAFWKDQALAESRLFTLAVVQRELQALARTWGTSPMGNSVQARAEVLRGFLIKHVEALCPNMTSGPPNPPPSEWIEYLILCQKYIEGRSRREVEAHLRGLGLAVTGGTYTRYLKAARERLARVIWQAELQAREG